MQLSIIVCVYNTEKRFLDECLSSIYSSTLQEAEYEVVLVDDGSTMDYSELTEKYPVRYYKIENLGPFRARIYGAELATGKYLAFLDSDDTVSMNYHLPMLNAAGISGADIVINGWAFRTERTCRTCIDDTTMASDICATGDEPLLLFSSQRGREHSYFVNWNKIYNRNLISETLQQIDSLGLSQQRIDYAEDALFNFFNFKNAKKVINIHSGFYLYRIHGNQNSKENDKQKLKKHIEGMAGVLDCMLNNIGVHKQRAEIEENIKAWRELMSRSHYQVALALGYTEIFPYIKRLYRVERLEKPYMQDGSVYTRAELLGENFEEIDIALSNLYLAEERVDVLWESKCRWIQRVINSTTQLTGKCIRFDKNSKYRIPERYIRIIDKVIHNHIVYQIGMRLFKKGSKIRIFLKRAL